MYTYMYILTNTHMYTNTHTHTNTQYTYTLTNTQSRSIYNNNYYCTSLSYSFVMQPLILTILKVVDNIEGDIVCAAYSQ